MYINNISEFHEYVGETIEYCQCVENDIRWIYSAMLKDSFQIAPIICILLITQTLRYSHLICLRTKIRVYNPTPKNTKNSKNWSCCCNFSAKERVP